MYDFTTQELSLIAMSLDSVSQATHLSIIEMGAEAPDGFVETLHSVIHKFERVLELRSQNLDRFNDLVKALTDVQSTAQQIVKNPETTTPDYN